MIEWKGRRIGSRPFTDGAERDVDEEEGGRQYVDRKSTRLNSSH